MGPSLALQTLSASVAAMGLPSGRRYLDEMTGRRQGRQTAGKIDDLKVLREVHLGLPPSVVQLTASGVGARPQSRPWRTTC